METRFTSRLQKPIVSCISDIRGPGLNVLRRDAVRVRDEYDRTCRIRDYLMYVRIKYGYLLYLPQPRFLSLFRTEHGVRSKCSEKEIEHLTSPTPWLPISVLEQCQE